MRVCFIALSPFPGIYLPEVRHMANELAALGIEHTVIAQRTGNEPAEELGNHRVIKRLWARNRFEVESFFTRAAAIADAGKYDVIHVIWRFGAGIVPIRSRWLKKHALLDVRTGSIDPRGWRRLFENSILRADRSQYSWVTTVDVGLAQALNLKPSALLPHGVSREMIELKKNLHQSKVQLRVRYDFRPDEIVGLYVGTSVMRNLTTLFEAGKAVKANHPKFRLVVVGDAVHDNQLVEVAAKTQTTLMPSVTGPQLAEYLAFADFGISFVPITPGFTNQQSTKLLDYFLFHLPVVATRTNSNAQYVTPANGILCEDSLTHTVTALTTMVNNLNTPEYLDGVGAHNEMLVEQFSWQNTVSQSLLPLYKKISSQ